MILTGEVYYLKEDIYLKKCTASCTFILVFEQVSSHISDYLDILNYIYLFITPFCQRLIGEKLYLYGNCNLSKMSKPAF